MALFGVAMLAIGLALFAAAWWPYSRRRQMADTPTSKVRSMALGRVELAGRAVVPPGAAALAAPFTGAPCLYWAYQIEERRTRVVTRTVNGKSQTHTEEYWATIDKGRSKEPVGLQDDTGVARIDVADVDPPAPTTARFGSGFLNDPPPTLVAFLQQRGLKHEGMLGFNKTLRYTERRLPERTPLYVLGTAVRPPDATEEGNAALVVRKVPGDAFLLSDKSERELTARWTVAFWAFLLAGMALTALGVWRLTGAT